MRSDFYKEKKKERAKEKYRKMHPLVELVCKFCNKKFKPKNNNGGTLYCSNECKPGYRGMKARNNLPHLSTGTKGALKELLVCADLLIKGFHVFRSVSPNASCDVIAMKNKNMLRVEITTAWKSATGATQFVAHKKENYDVIALVFQDGSIEYQPALGS